MSELHPGSHFSREAPEHPRSREFVYDALVEQFGIFDDSELRPGGRRRGFQHADSLARLHTAIGDRLDEYNIQNPHTALDLARTAIPKAMRELKELGIVDYSIAGDRVVYFESVLFSDGHYVEEKAKDLFRFAAPSSTMYYHAGDGSATREVMQKTEQYELIRREGPRGLNPTIKAAGQFKPRSSR